jgi:hypothetical protein
MKTRIVVRIGIIVAALVIAAVLLGVARAQQPASTTAVMFVENVGQFDAHAHFQVQGARGALWLADDALWITLLERPSSPQPPSPIAVGEGGAESPLSRSAGEWAGGAGLHGVHIKLSFVGANPHPRLEPFNRLNTYVSYFLGSDPTRWYAGVPVWGGVRYVDLYPGIDLELSGEGGRLEPRIIAREGADASQVRLRAEGADDTVQETGDLTMLRSLPFNPFPESVDSRSLSLVYSTYLGGSYYDYGWDIAADASGATYIAGTTLSGGFPTTPGAFQTAYGGSSDAFITKLNAAGSALVYSTFLGGIYGEEGYSIALDSSGAVYVSGQTYSDDFPTTLGAYQTDCGGSFCDDAFVTKLNTNGTALLYSTFLGGSGGENAYGVTVSTSAAAYVSGTTASVDFPVTSGAFQTYRRGSSDAFITALNPSGNGLLYSTYLGGDTDEWAGDIAVDATGAAYTTGFTSSTNFPTTPGSFTPNWPGLTNAFISKLNPAGNSLTYSTYLGGSEGEQGEAIAVDSAGAAYVSGATSSPNFPVTLGAFQTVCGGGCYANGDAFVVKLNAAGSALAYGTFLGGATSEGARSLAVDASGVGYISGYTRSTNFPTTPGAFQPTCSSCPGDNDAFVTQLNAAGSGLLYSTFLGGNSVEEGYAIAAGSGAAYITGYTQSSNFPTSAGAFDPTPNGVWDAFVTRLAVPATFSFPLATDGLSDIAVSLDVSAVITDAESLADFVEAQGGTPPGSVRQLLKWHAPSQNFLAWSHEFQFGDNFPLALGDYVFLVSSGGPSSVTFTGRRPAPGELQFALTAGQPSPNCALNFVSLPFDQASITNADQLADAIGTPNPPGPPTVLQTLDWGTGAQNFYAWSNEFNFGDNFSTVPGHPYIVCVTNTAPLIWP